MRKRLEEMSERELLEELVAEKRQQETLRWIGWGLRLVVVIAIAVLLAIYLPPVIAYFRQLAALVEQVKSTLEQLKTTADQLQSALNGVTQGSSDALREAAERLNELLNGLKGLFGR